MADCPEGMVLGVAIPETLKGAPLCVNREIVRSLPPVLLNVTGKLLFVPTVTAPKDKLAGFTVKTGCNGRAVAWSVIGTSPVAWLVFRVKVALVFPAVVPSNQTLKFSVCPAGKEAGREMPEVENCILDRLASAMTPSELPVFVTDTVCDDFVPTVTLPKFTVAGVA